MASKRRATFASAAAAAEQLGSKPPFSLWDPRVLQLYLTHGLRPVETGSQGGLHLCVQLLYICDDGQTRDGMQATNRSVYSVFVEGRGMCVQVQGGIGCWACQCGRAPAAVYVGHF